MHFSSVQSGVSRKNELKLIMAYRRSLRCCFVSLLSVTAFILSVVKSNVTPSRLDADSKCHAYNTYNYYSGHVNPESNKKMETLLHRVLNELREIREEIRALKENKTTGK